MFLRFALPLFFAALPALAEEGEQHFASWANAGWRVGSMAF